VKADVKFLRISKENLLEKFLVTDFVQEETGELLAACNNELTEIMLDSFIEAKINDFEILYIDGITYSDSFRKTLALDKVTTGAEAILEIYRRLRPSSPPTIEVAQTFFNNLFFNKDLYDLSEVGRYKINARLGLDTDIDHRALTKDDIIESVLFWFV